MSEKSIECDDEFESSSDDCVNDGIRSLRLLRRHSDLLTPSCLGIFAKDEDLLKAAFFLADGDSHRGGRVLLPLLLLLLVGQ